MNHYSPNKNQLDKDSLNQEESKGLGNTNIGSNYKTDSFENDQRNTIKSNGSSMMRI